MQAHLRHLIGAAAALAAFTVAAPLAYAQAYPPYPPYPPPYGPYPPPAYYAPPPPAPAQPSGPAMIAPWDPDQPPPAGYYLSSKVNGGLIGGGVAILTSFWTVSVIGAAIAAKDEEEAGIDGDGVESDDWTPLYFPIVGPFITVNSVDAGSDGAAVLVIDGVLQTLGAFMIGWGIADRNYRVIRSPMGTPRSRVPLQIGSQEIEVSPIVGRSFRGVGLRASF
jgi:hypothetical protein